MKTHTERLLLNVKESLRSSFVKNAAVVASGTAVAQGVAFLFAPLLSRMFTPEQFGSFAILTSLVNLFASFSAVSYEQAIVLPKKNEHAANLVSLSAFIACIVFVVSLSLLLVTRSTFWEMLQIPFREQIWFFFLPLVILAHTLANVMIFWNNRLLFFKFNSVYKIILSLGVAITAVTFGMLFPSHNGLITSFLFGNILFSAGFILYSWNRTGLRNISQSKRDVMDRAREYDQFPKYYLIQNFFDAFRENALVIIIQSAFSASILGAYAFALRIVRMPLNLISTSISQVAYQKIASLKNENQDTRAFVYRLILVLVAISLPMALIFLFYGPEIFVFVFGDQWNLAGHYAQFISVWVFSNFICSPISTIPLIYGKARMSFYLSMLFNVITIGVFYTAATVTEDAEKSLLITSLVAGLYLLIYAALIVQIVNKYSHDHTD